MSKIKSVFMAAAIAAMGVSGAASAATGPVGTWTIGFDWYCDGNYSKTTITFYSGGTFAAGGSTGVWWNNFGTHNFTFSNGTTYTGAHIHKSMTGHQRSFSGAPGCWYAHPNDGFNYDTGTESADSGTDVTGASSGGKGRR